MRRKIAKKIAPHMSALRRHARALGADKELIGQTLAAVDNHAYRQLAERDVRPRLFRDFHDVYENAQPQNAAQTDSHGLMLRYSQGFSMQDVADILRCDIFDLQKRLAGAYQRLHAQASSDVLIVEDDPVLANGLIEMIESMGHRVLGVARDQDEAVSTARAIRFDAVVADLHDGHGWSGGRDEAKARDPQRPQLLNTLGVPIVTVVPQVEADGDGPAYVVGTPFQAAELKVMLSQALTNR